MLLQFLSSSSEMFPRHCQIRSTIYTQKSFVSYFQLQADKTAKHCFQMQSHLFQKFSRKWNKLKTFWVLLRITQHIVTKPQLEHQVQICVGSKQGYKFYLKVTSVPRCGSILKQRIYGSRFCVLISIVSHRSFSNMSFQALLLSPFCRFLLCSQENYTTSFKINFVAYSYCERFYINVWCFQNSFICYFNSSLHKQRLSKCSEIYFFVTCCEVESNKFSWKFFWVFKRFGVSRSWTSVHSKKRRITEYQKYVRCLEWQSQTPFLFS